MSDIGEIFCDIIATYSGRDKVMKVLCYTAKVLATPNLAITPENAKQFYTFSSKISQARATLRLIDDLPTIRYALAYGMGREEKYQLDAILGVLTNIVDVLYFPIDKICWLSEHKIIKLNNPYKWDVISSLFWSLSAFLNLTRVLRDYHDKHILAPHAKDTSDAQMRINEQKRFMESITVIRMSLDLVHAVSSLPRGWLWGGELKTWQVGVIGSLSGLLGVYQYVVKTKKSKKH